MRRSEHLAARWAAKEALHKALGGALRVRFRDVCVRAAASGAPELQLDSDAEQRVAALGGGAVHLSLAHEGDYALAHVVVERASNDVA